MWFDDLQLEDCSILNETQKVSRLFECMPIRGYVYCLLNFNRILIMHGASIQLLFSIKTQSSLSSFLRLVLKASVSPCQDLRNRPSLGRRRFLLSTIGASSCRPANRSTLL